MIKKGFFITLEGGEGTGKSTQIALLKEALEKKNISVVLTREPGGSAPAEEIRKVLLSGGEKKWDSISELLLFSAARRNHLTELVWPAMEKGNWVISDRYADSTMAYQGYGRKDNLLTKEDISAVYRLIAGDFQPDLTILLDIDPEMGLRRVQSRGVENRLDKMGLEFHQNLRAAYLDIAAKDPGRFKVIDASHDISTIHHLILKAISEHFQWD